MNYSKIARSYRVARKFDSGLPREHTVIHERTYVEGKLQQAYVGADLAVMKYSAIAKTRSIAQPRAFDVGPKTLCSARRATDCG